MIALSNYVGNPMSVQTLSLLLVVPARGDDGSFIKKPRRLSYTDRA